MPSPEFTRIRTVRGPYTISTVQTDPGCYETMVFVGGSYTEVDFDRYYTGVQATAGHHRISEKWEDVLAANVALLGEGFWEIGPPCPEGGSTPPPISV